MSKLKNRRTGILYACIFVLSVLISLKVERFYAQQMPEESDELSLGFSAPLTQAYDGLSDDEGCSYIVYVLDGAVNNIENPDRLEAGQTMTLGLPHKFGYYFQGWYLDPDFKYKVKEVTGQKGKAVTVYAKWLRKVNNVYNVENYEYSSSERLNPDTVLLKDCDYYFIEDLKIPGMPETKEEDFFNNYIFSESQCPQGLCIADDYILITSYSEEEDCMGELMVFDITTGDYLLTLGMDSMSHLGGITYDGENVWVCNSNNNTVERISYDFIKLMATQNPKEFVDATAVVDVYPVKNKPSCITCYGGRLWVATHTLMWKSKMVAYYFNSDANELNALNKYTIPAKVQGVAFDDNGKVYLSTSYGRNSSSYMKIYSSLIKLSSEPGKPEKQIEMPPGSEEIDVRNDTAYVIFETAGEKYLEGTDGKGFCVSPLDKILAINIADF